MVTHDTFVCTRSVQADPARAFRAWSEVDIKRKWFAGPPDRWTEADRTFDFRVGGKETLLGLFQAGGSSFYDATFLDIVPNERIVYAYRMSVDGELISVSLSTVEFSTNGTGAEVRYTEQAAYYHPEMGRESRQHGTEVLMDNFAASLETTHA